MVLKCVAQDVCVSISLCVFTPPVGKNSFLLGKRLCYPPLSKLQLWRARGHVQSNVCFPRFKNDFSLSNIVFQIPRTIVSVVQILQMKPLREVQCPTLTCQLQKSSAIFSSSSAFNLLNHLWNCRTYLILKSWLSAMMCIRSQQIIFRSCQCGEVKCCVFISYTKCMKHI